MLQLIDRARARFPSTASFKLTDTLLEEIITELRGGKANPVRIATKLGVPIALVRYVSNEIHNGPTTFTTHSEDGWGRAELRDFIVTRKLANGDWPKEDESIIQYYRDKYDEGIYELAQGRDGNFIILYGFPRYKKAKRTYAYFKLEEEI